MEVTKQIRNDVFKRQEVVLELEADKNPSFAETRTKLAEKFKKPEENIDVYSIQGKFGKNVFVISANIYDSKEELGKILQLKKTQKTRIAEKKDVEDAKKAEVEAKKKAEEDSKAAKEAAAEEKVEAA